ncbi:MAG TPA: hypothetical protein V6D33_12515 [Cyanophyceae cyanobacterium]
MYSPATSPILVDSFYRSLMEFVADELNAKFSVVRQLHELGIPEDSPEAEPIKADNGNVAEKFMVKTRRDDDTYDWTLLDFPLLKVYEVAANGEIGNSVWQIGVRITYLQRHANIHRLPGLRSWLRRTMGDVLADYQLNHTGCCCNIDARSRLRCDHSTRRMMVKNVPELYFASDFDFEAICS